jgi:hypothetical protein
MLMIGLQMLITGLQMLIIKKVVRTYLHMIRRGYISSTVYVV